MGNFFGGPFITAHHTSKETSISSFVFNPYPANVGNMVSS